MWEKICGVNSSPFTNTSALRGGVWVARATYEPFVANIIKRDCSLCDSSGIFSKPRDELWERHHRLGYLAQSPRRILHFAFKLTDRA